MPHPDVDKSFNSISPLGKISLYDLSKVWIVMNYSQDLLCNIDVHKDL